MSDPRGFMKFPREEGSYRPIAERRQDWQEIFASPGISHAELKKQGARCMDCGVPFCQSGTGCPVDNLIPEWNTLVNQDRWQEALVRLQMTNNFPEFTGRLCPAPCESSCVLGVNSDPVTIKEIEWSIIDRGFAEGWIQPAKIPPATGFKVAVVGSGPAGLAAAQQLTRKGHKVIVFEKAANPGGLLRYGIPDFKFKKWRVDRRLRQLEAEGIEFRTSVNVGTDISLTQLKAEFDGICLAVGAEQPRDIGPIPGRDLEGIHFAMDYLIEQNKKLESGISTSSKISARGLDVIVLGGGDTGSDCVGTAHRQGAKSVTQIEIMPQPPLERCDSTPWPNWPLQLRTSHAHEEGGHREWGLATQQFLGENGRVKRLIGKRVGSSTLLELPADLVILALGFTGPRISHFINEFPMQVDARGNLLLDASMMTSTPGIFAAGDVHRGASLIVWAIAEGRKMAEGVHRFLSSRAQHPACPNWTG